MTTMWDNMVVKPPGEDSHGCITSVFFFFLIHKTLQHWTLPVFLKSLLRCRCTAEFLAVLLCTCVELLFGFSSIKVCIGRWLWSHSVSVSVLCPLPGLFFVCVRVLLGFMCTWKILIIFSDTPATKGLSVFLCPVFLFSPPFDAVVFSSSRFLGWLD